MQLQEKLLERKPKFLLGKKRSDWKGIPVNFSKLMKSKRFNVEKFERVKFYGPNTSHIVAILRKN